MNDRDELQQMELSKQVLKDEIRDEPYHVRRKDLVETTDDMPMAEPVLVKTRFGKFATISGSLVRTKEFDERFYYPGRLGAFYGKDRTILRLWAPTAQEVTVEVWESLEPLAQIASRVEMYQTDAGVWEAELTNDQHETSYTYHLTFSDGTGHSTADPYARAVTVGGDRSVILDPDTVYLEGFYRMPPFSYPTDAVIYEMHIRDFSMDPHSGIVRRGKFLGVVETGTKNPNGSATGLDYLKSLGITHVQILPMYDFATVDEISPQTGYNWGYDPKNFNAPEGSYATNPMDPACRILELKQMIKGLHDAGLRVIMDVVYNHVYEVSDHPLHKTAPGYFFRYDQTGKLANGTGVGNDTASERRMMRKYILDSLRYWAEEFHLDGFRFDLMGIHDVETMNEARHMLDQIDPSIILLGEGWNLGTELPDADKAWQGNAQKMPRIAHFNDSMRDSVKGSTFDFAQRGFISGEHRDQKEVAHNLLGRSDGHHGPSYLGPDQLIQYVEAHDNLTLYDKLLLTNPRDSEEVRVRRHTLATSLVLLAQGIPFIHGGQEFLRTKSGVENSYRSTDAVNQFDWLRQDKYRSTVEYVQGLIHLRRENSLLRLRDYQAIKASSDLMHNRGGMICLRLRNRTAELLILINSHEKAQSADVPKGNWKILVHDLSVPKLPSTLNCNNGKIQVGPLSVTVMSRD